MSLLVVALILLVMSLGAIGAGLSIVVRDRGTTTTKTRSGVNTKLTTDGASVKGEFFAGKEIAVRRKGSISAEETGRLRAEGNVRLPRAVAAMVVGFSLLFVALGVLIVSLGGATAGPLIVAAVLFTQAIALPFGWFRREREAKVAALGA